MFKLRVAVPWREGSHRETPFPLGEKGRGSPEEGMEWQGDRSGCP